MIPAVFAIIDVLREVMGKMAPLAKSYQVIKAIVGLDTVNMSNGKYHPTASHGVRLIVFRPTPFTAIFRPLKADKPAYQRPFGVIVFVVYGHWYQIRGSQ